MIYRDSIWFTNATGIIGIVIGEDENTHEKKAYIGVGEGNDPAVDIQKIMDFGSPFFVNHIASKMR